MSNASRSYVPVVQSSERAISDLSFGVQSVRRLTSATPADIIRLDALSADLANIITRLDQGK